MLVNSDLLSAALTRKIQNGQKLNSILDTCAFNRTNGAKFALATKVLKKFLTVPALRLYIDPSVSLAKIYNFEFGASCRKAFINSSLLNCVSISFDGSSSALQLNSRLIGYIQWYVPSFL